MASDDARVDDLETITEDLDAHFFAEDLDEFALREHVVTTVLVSHDGARWLPAVLTALSRSTLRPDWVIGVDTGSVDDTQVLMRAAADTGLIDLLVELPRDTGFGTAVARGIEAEGELLADGSHGPHEPPRYGAHELVATVEDPADLLDAPVAWIWLLHDDSAPDPAALASLLLAADRDHTVEILGSKLRGWRNESMLVECGVTVARSGNRVTGLERRELDQGQHDGVRDVLAVSTAGMLVRRDVWDALGGFDPALPMFRDDIDFCWRARRAGYRVVVATDAVVHHREAATHSRRVVDAGSPKHPERPRRLDRSAAIHLMRAHSSGLRRPFVTTRLLVGTIVRAIGLLLGKAPDQARDEWGAFRDAVRDRAALRSSRARVDSAGRGPASVSDSDVRTLLAHRGVQARHALESVADLVAGRDSVEVRRSVLDSTPDDPSAWLGDDHHVSRLRRWAAQPATLLVCGLVLVALIGARSLLGAGELLGGALVPAPAGAADLWAAYTSAWHEVGAGSAADAPAWLIPLALLAALLRGSASSAVDVLLLLLVPMAGLTSYLALRGVVVVRWARIWAAVTYATLPAVTGAISGGRIGTAAAIVLLPWLARSCARLVGIGRAPTWRRVFGTSLLLAVVASFTPVLWLAAALLALIASVTYVRDAKGRVRLLLTVLVPVALLMPWSLRIIREPALLWLEPGLTGPTDAHLTALDVALLRPGGVGSTPLWLGFGIVLAGLVALAVPGRRRPVAAAWVVGLCGLMIGVVESVLRVTVSAIPDPVAPWPGVATALWGGALILAATLTMDRLPRLLAISNFTWRQPAAGMLLILLALAPLGSLALVVIGIDGPLTRGSRDVLPAFVAADMRGLQRPRALVLSRLTDHRLAYDLLSAPEPALGDLDVAGPQWVTTEIDLLVARLAGGVGADEITMLAAHGIRYVVLTRVDVGGEGDPLVDTLDGQRGVRRLASRGGDAVWQLSPVSSRAQVSASASVGRGSAPVRMAVEEPRVTTSIDTTVTAGPAGRRLILAEASNGRWLWSINGISVTPQAGVGVESEGGVEGGLDPSVQHVALPDESARVVVTFDGTSRRRWLWAQAAVIIGVVILALPSRRREIDDDADEVPESGAEREPVVGNPSPPIEVVQP
ncbi:MAG: glycosyltransferase [Actinobacteria bacterium]|uniref:Unannotated protein n=1 Tax=freshwater metagenome TaxID=449393 RepID=A0A6J7S067_9ZZZZ|nr:glycosyltransferase [Actinomycetota bacterium]